MGSGPRKMCDLRGCEARLEGRRRRYCSDRCQQTAAARRYRARQQGAVSIEVTSKAANTSQSKEFEAGGRVAARKPPDWFVEDGWFDAINDGTHSMKDVADRTKVALPNISKWFEYVRREREVLAQADGWTRPPEAERALTDFRFFRERYFVAARGIFKGKPYATEPFHLKWIDAVLDTLPEEAGGNGERGVGGQQLILSPPRLCHGKTELLAHFCIWLMLRNPDIVVIWIAKAERQAKEVGSLIHDQLQDNEKLAAEMLGPGGSFKPPTRSGSAWRDDEFEIATRTVPQKAPTFRSIGRGGNLQSVDADLIVTDDIEDHDSTRTPHQRDATREWLLTEVESRKEMHTAWLCIGSRNHPHDVLDHLLGLEDWNAIVETAHDAGCEQPVEDPAAHVDCMLWPTKFPYTELMKKVANSGQQIVQMRYLNDPVGDGVVVFTEAAMRSPEVLDRSRVLGQLDLPQGYDLLGSIDPGSTFQISELWAFSKTAPTRFLIDIVDMKGGMDAWEDLVENWLVRYQLRRWAVEDNSLQSDYINRRDFVKRRHELGIHVHGATTGRNKHSLSVGVASMAPLYTQGAIVLPYGDAQTQGKVDAFIREHVSYDPDVPQSRYRRIDRVMAAWFANDHIDTLQGGRVDTTTVDETPDFLTPEGTGWVEDEMSGGWL